MRVVLNQLSTLRRKSGVGHYAEQLGRALRLQAEPDEVEFYPAGGTRRLWRSALRALQRTGGAVPVLGKSAKSWRVAVAEQLRRAGVALATRHFRRVCRRRGYDLYHEPNFIPLAAECPAVATLHDLSVLRHPQWHPADRVHYFEREFPRILSSCLHFVTVSQFARREVISMLGVAPARVTAVPNGVRSGLRPLPVAEVRRTLHSLGLPEQYLLHVGTIEPRKNVLMLLRAYCALPANLRERWPLLLVGGWGWGTADVAAYWQDHARHCGVIVAGYVPDARLAAVYNGARALLYPSHYEGFGLPPLEMMACGGAVLASTAGAVVETAGGQAHLLPAADEDGWRAAMARVVADDDWWDIVRRGAVATAQPYTWERSAAATLDIYRSLCASRGATSTPQRPAA